MSAQTQDCVVRIPVLPPRPSAVAMTSPLIKRGGLIVACPHSGRFYPPELLAVSVLDEFALRRCEDAFVDKLLQDAPKVGATLLVNTFGRAFVDVNRSAAELDPKLIRDTHEHDAQTKSERVKAGLGVIPRTVGDNISIYKSMIAHHEAVKRLNEVHIPWHSQIETSLCDALNLNGAAVLLDCHSMPHAASGDPSCDIVLGDRFGSSCAPLIMQEAFTYLKTAGLHVRKNDPYAGGYSTSRHGQPLRQHHALQIELNRGLYMVEGALTLRPAHEELRHVMAGFLARLVEISEFLGRNIRGQRRFTSPIAQESKKLF